MRLVLVFSGFLERQADAVDGVGVSRCFFAPGVSNLFSFIYIYTGQTRLFVSNSRSLEGFRALRS